MSRSIDGEFGSIVPCFLSFALPLKILWSSIVSSSSGTDSLWSFRFYAHRERLRNEMIDRCDRLHVLSLSGGLTDQRWTKLLDFTRYLIKIWRSRSFANSLSWLMFDVWRSDYGGFEYVCLHCAVIRTSKTVHLELLCVWWFISSTTNIAQPLSTESPPAESWRDCNIAEGENPYDSRWKPQPPDLSDCIAVHHPCRLVSSVFQGEYMG